MAAKVTIKATNVNERFRIHQAIVQAAASRVVFEYEPDDILFIDDYQAIPEIFKKAAAELGNGAIVTHGKQPEILLGNSQSATAYYVNDRKAK